VPPTIDFHAQHSPLGAFASLTCGLGGARGGLGLELGRPANHDLYVGVKSGPRVSDDPIRCLPFHAGAAEDTAARFLVEQAETDPNSPDPARGITPSSIGDLHRIYGAATDRFVSSELEFALFTPVPSLPDPASATTEALRRALLPAIVGELVVDNTAGSETKTAVLALGLNEPGMRLLEPQIQQRRLGFAQGHRLGILAELDPSTDGLFLFSRFSVAEGVRDATRIHRLGSCPGVGFEVPPGQQHRLRVAFGVHRGDTVTSGLHARYLYARYYASLEAVLHGSRPSRRPRRRRPQAGRRARRERARRRTAVSHRSRHPLVPR
jgi:hypothetical protein